MPALPLSLVLLLLLLSISQVIAMASHPIRWVEMETMPDHIQTMREVSWGDRTPPSTQHTCVFFLNNPRDKEFQELAEAIANPKSPMYGKHLTKEQVDAMTRNDAGIQAVEDYLTSLGATIVKKTGHSIEATAPISVWETALNTQFRDVSVPIFPNQVLHRATTFYLPEHLAQHVNLVTNTVQIPAQIRGGPVMGNPAHTGPKLHGAF